MPLSLRAAIVVILVVSAFPPAALAERGRAAAAGRQPAGSPPVKDCTRLNGRIGYYANPWCSPAEQERWDRWEASRVRLR